MTTLAIGAMVYGVPPKTPEKKLEDEIKLFEYLRALIYAESINPETDWDGEGQTELLEMIAKDIGAGFREQLVKQLKYEEDE